MPPLLEGIILVSAPFAPLFSQRVWLHAQLLLLGGPNPILILLAKSYRSLSTRLRRQRSKG